MQELGLQPKDLVHLLNMNKSSLSLILNKKRGMTKSNRAMLYYMFKYLEKEPMYKVGQREAVKEFI
ncbi:hypothetical protein FACS1894199_07210 [Bacteroidia bacterium]|nr:hypothetical protein FACS1894199_07210 [Bacteroidia bacterium]